MSTGNQHKYVRHSTVGFIVWPAQYPGLTHKEVGDSIRMSEDAPRGNVISAGFVDWDFDGRPFCHGSSESMRTGCQPGDTEALLEQWGMTTPAPVLNSTTLAEARKFGEGLSDESLEHGEPAL